MARLVKQKIAVPMINRCRIALVAFIRLTMFVGFNFCLLVLVWRKNFRGVEI
jgi:hypothetical protein